MEKQKIEDCPFCGKKGEPCGFEGEGENQRVTHVTCYDCLPVNKYDFGTAIRIEIWNKRAKKE